MKILVRLPNWLGDMVMSIGFIDALQQVYPNAAISVIAKKGIDAMLQFFPSLAHQFIFSKEEFSGLRGVWRFGRMIKKTEKFDLFFSLPDSFSAAFMGFASGAKKRVGYKKELRFVFLTHVFTKKKSLHLVEEYVDLLQQYSNNTIGRQQIKLLFDPLPGNDNIIININSEASSRRLPIQKSVSIINMLQQKYSSKLLLIGGKADIFYVEEVINQLRDVKNIINLAGKTSLPELVKEMATAKIVLTTDSGPAHLANACGTYTIVLFGAGNEHNTAPFNAGNSQVIRLGKLPCEPCVKNTCVLFGIPKCLQLLDEERIFELITNYELQITKDGTKGGSIIRNS